MRRRVVAADVIAPGRVDDRFYRLAFFDETLDHFATMNDQARRWSLGVVDAEESGGASERA